MGKSLGPACRRVDGSPSLAPVRRICMAVAVARCLPRPLGMAVDPQVGAPEHEAETMEGFSPAPRRTSVRCGHCAQVRSSKERSRLSAVMKVLVDLGGRSAGVLSAREANAEGMSIAVRRSCARGGRAARGSDGRVVLSMRRARNRRQVGADGRPGEDGELIEAVGRRSEPRRTGRRRRPFAARAVVAGSRRSGASSRPPARDQSAVPEALRAYVGKRLPLKVIEADPRRDRLILSEKAASQGGAAPSEEEAAHQLSEGDELDGTVSSVTTFGLFRRYRRGRWSRPSVRDHLAKSVEPTSLYKPGDPVRRRRLRDRPGARAYLLSIKRRQEDPWAWAVRELRVGSETEATVTE